MADKSDPNDLFQDAIGKQTEMMQKLFGTFMSSGRMQTPPMFDPSSLAGMDAPQDMRQNIKGWAEVSAKLQKMWLDFQNDQRLSVEAPIAVVDPMQWAGAMQDWFGQMPLTEPEKQKELWEESLQLWQTVLGRYGIGPEAMNETETELPRTDRRFKDRRWSDQPAFALIHQTYLLIAERLDAMIDEMEGLDDAKREQLRFATRAVIEASSPANFAATNPIVLERTMETKGENLVRGMEHLITDLKKGQLTHTDPDAFTLGENIAATPGKVVYETPLYQLIQYSPTTEEVLETPLVIFPPWINRFYILDLNPKNSFIRWAVEQGVTTFVVSWKSADESMADVVWDDYILAQIDAINHIRERLKVPSVHAIGYCVAGTTLAATLAILHRRKEEKKVKSATFFTAQVDFSKAGELLHFIDDQQLAGLETLTPKGYLDGRYMAAAFNLLRGEGLIWNYWVNNYLLGEDYPAFDLLHWNGDVTNLPAKWHRDYLTDLYRDNKLVQPDAMAADNTPIDLTKVKTPAYVQAGKEDHIAPAESVWHITDHFEGPLRFVLAGSGHIAGVVNPPSSGKYQYWTNENKVSSLEEFKAGATETAGSWWPDWIEWLQSQDNTKVPAKGKRKPGGRGDKVIEDAPGRYVKKR
ncbi:class I poly(R)-hydroxyalkanoic acid synthase [Pontixanthobacter aestiaquae]|uniref:Class I poly(R)-hydroxyalkanoic acid synthase n=1 Tax=Pontixanthobacter aestiaquae TaxID=1509367 RepID=A0A844Z1F8_9SPHN|nr:class I poly(R)-hydroxyalkanoic acid synthase [Pontixanthobacter aestiaquae]MDN3646451.1 class I poly(R)-hydroxyalkanoic acid synthase [Pontixanthobacter aestiaquae]MXO82561.1 class I poly(R)-hydroxyalkanoic acid synthase [Pontixanthobacter aestiaquae]